MPWNLGEPNWVVFASWLKSEFLLLRNASCYKKGSRFVLIRGHSAGPKLFLFLASEAYSTECA